MDAAVLRRYLQPSPTLRWHPWAPLVAAILFVAFVFGLGAAWGFSVATGMADKIRIYSEPWREVTNEQVAAKWPGRLMVGRARSFDAAVMRGARELESEASVFHRARVSLEESLFAVLFRSDGNPRRRFDLRESLRDSGRQAAEYRLTNLSGAASQWQPTASLCREVAPGFDLRPELERAAAAYSVVLGRTITAQQLAPLSGARCD